MRRLVVGDVLPGDGQAILRIVHQGVEPVRRRQRRGVNAQLLAVVGAPDDFLAPVAEKIGAERRRGLGAGISLWNRRSY